jgi:hypothetical protein
MAEDHTRIRISRVAILIALAFIPIFPYLVLGYTGQDLPFHVCSWLDLKDGWRSGLLSPGWSAAANYGRGDPHLTLYPPASNFLGAFLTVLLPLKLAPGAFAWIALALSGLSMYFASKPFLEERDRMAAAILYMLGPYTITTSLVRFDAAELLVQAWLPLIALYFYQAVWVSDASSDEASRPNRRALILLAFLLGLSWITNIPASIVLVYSLGTAAVLCAFLERSVRPLFRIVLSEVLAAALATFYLCPVWKEQTWVQPDALTHFDSADLLLFMPHSNFNDSPLLIVCWIFLCAQMVIVVACLRKRTLPFDADPAVAAWASVAAASFLLQSPLAIPVWKYAPELRFVQFPLRFLSILGVALPLLLLSRGTRRSLRHPAYLLIALLSTTPFLGYLSKQAIAINRSPPLPALLASWRTQGTPEYLPAGALIPIGPANFPVISSVDASNPLAIDPTCQTIPEQQSSDLHIFRTRSLHSCRVRLTVYFYPYWRALDESNRPLGTLRESTGLLLIDVPAGEHTITVTFRAVSELRTLSAIISLITVLLLVAALVFDRRHTGSVSHQQDARPIP